jgi:hypothetical protein
MAIEALALSHSCLESKPPGLEKFERDASLRNSKLLYVQGACFDKEPNANVMLWWAT